MQIAAQAAPEIDRLVLAVGREVNERHGSALLERARQLGLDSMAMLPHLGDFLAAGTLTHQLARIRLRYMSSNLVQGRLRQLEELGLIRQTNGTLAATEDFRVLLDQLAAAQADVATLMWSEHPGSVDTASRVAAELAAAADDEHVVAVAHRALPESPDPFGRLERRLVTLRYIRNHDHARAWEGEGLSAPEIVVITKIWRDEPVDVSDDIMHTLIDRAFLAKEPIRLTDEGREMRERIEAETNRRAQETFDRIPEADAFAFLEAIRVLPSTIE